MDSVTVLTLTRNRPAELSRALVSVASQSQVDIQHIIVADRCEFLSSNRGSEWIASEFPSVQVIHNNSHRHDYLPTHLSKLRFEAGLRADGDWIALLDDDNEFEHDHADSLVSLLQRTSCPIGHSWRTLWNREGEEWLISDFDPWAPDARSARASFEILEKEGMFVRGSNVIRDCLQLPKSKRIGRVDTNEWFFRRAAFSEYARPREPSPAEKRLKLTEDILLTVRLVREGIDVSCSELPTVRYRMGGYSNENVVGINPLDH